MSPDDRRGPPKASDRGRRRSWEYSIITRENGVPVREYHITVDQIRRWKRLALFMGGTAAILLGILLATFPRSWSYGRLLDENLELKQRVQDIEGRMSDVDRILLRLRMYDSQLRSLYEPDGSHGPIPDQEIGEDDAGIAHDMPIQWDGSGDDLQPLAGNAVEEWADSVIARMDGLVDMFEKAEPNLTHLVEELEDLRAVEQALPNRWPALGMLTSEYGYRRSPTYRATKFHKGIDIANKIGVPIFATASGTVVRAGWMGGYGWTVELDHGFGITTRYAHCNRLKVRRGAKVEQGQVIATMGRSGRVTGPHLHFEVRIDGHAVDPQEYLPR
jgi:hypothetical protein